MPFGIVSFTRVGFVTLKHAIRDHAPQLKSAHVDEALSYAFGFDTYAAMLPVLDLADRSGQLAAVANPSWFVVRLVHLGYDVQSVRSLNELIWSYAGEEGEARERNLLAKTLLSPQPANDA